MGKVKLDALQSNNTINHFSHPHPLELITHQNLASLCSGCKNQATGSIYTCKLCNFFLHPECSQMPQQITHPFDKEHPLTLHPKPIYSTGIFYCDACGKVGDGFCYHCKTCGTDLHILCAVFPLRITHWSHHHQLELQFSPPYPGKFFGCDICKNAGNNHWLYSCLTCGFDAHLSCTKLQFPPHQSHGHHNPTTSTSSRTAPQQHLPSGIGRQHFAGLNHMNQGNNYGAGVPPTGAGLQNNEMSFHEILRKQSEDQQKMVQEMILAATARQNEAINQQMAATSRQNQELSQQIMGATSNNQQIMQAIMNNVSGGTGMGQGGVPNIYQNMMGAAGGFNNGGGGANNILQALSGGGGGGGTGLLQSLMGGGSGGVGGVDLSSLFGGLSF